jgi:cob(I)alamin adenosyltransferase
MSIATKTGDKGDTSLLGGERVRKTDSRIEAYGTVDELNAAIGVAIAYVDGTAKSSLEKIQNHLFTIGAEIARITDRELTIETPEISSKHLEFLDKELKSLEESLPAQKEFILPRGSHATAHLHLARTICRRAERRIVECGLKYDVNSEILRYLNRLSDLLFLYARKESSGDEPVKYD